MSNNKKNLFQYIQTEKEALNLVHEFKKLKSLFTEGTFLAENDFKTYIASAKSRLVRGPSFLPKNTETVFP